MRSGFSAHHPDHSTTERQDFVLLPIYTATQPLHHGILHNNLSAPRGTHLFLISSNQQQSPLCYPRSHFALSHARSNLSIRTSVNFCACIYLSPAIVLLIGVPR